MEKKLLIEKDTAKKLLILSEKSDPLINFLGISLKNDEQSQAFISSLEKDKETNLLLINFLLERTMNPEQWADEERQFLIKENIQLKENVIHLEKVWHDSKEELNNARSSIEQGFHKINEENLVREHQRTSSLSHELGQNKRQLETIKSHNNHLKNQLEKLKRDYQNLVDSWLLLEKELIEVLQIYHPETFPLNNNLMEKNEQPSLNLEESERNTGEENEKKIQKLTEEIASYKPALEALKVAMRELQKKLQESEENLQKTREDLKNASQDLSTTQAQLTELKEEKKFWDEKLSQGIDSASEESERLKMQIEEMTNLLLSRNE